MYRLKNASRAAMTRSQLKQPNYSLSHAELLRLATLAPRDGKRARRRTGCREHV